MDKLQSGSAQLLASESDVTHKVTQTWKSGGEVTQVTEVDTNVTEISLAKDLTSLDHYSLDITTVEPIKGAQ